ncbi:MAG TPA: hypothetical protein VN035_03820, partial [Microbacterium sp.]|nr:hypothetical protein [Microbacterium sp.]
MMAAVRDAVAAWDDRAEAVLAIPLTDDDAVLTLTGDDTVATTLTVDALRAAFADAGLTLHLDADAPGGEIPPGFEEFEAEFAGEPDDELDEVGADLFEPTPVQVAAFSHRGPAVARLLAEANRTTVAHIEAGEWSVQRFRTADPTAGWVSSRAELPVIEVNRTDAGDTWIEVTAGSGTVPFWPDAERDTQPVLDIDAIRVPETAEVYRRLLTEGDGGRDELIELATLTRLDVDAAHRALIAESLGGVGGTQERRRAFLLAFGIPDALIAQAFDGADAPGVRRFEPVGWPSAVWSTLVAGVGELTPLTRRNTFFPRAAAAIRRRPALGLAISTGE